MSPAATVDHLNLPAVAGARSVLFTGGCRSGKSGLAQSWAEFVAPSRAYVATSRQVGSHAPDAEMLARVQRHQADRGAGWLTVEPEHISPHGPLDAVAALRYAASHAQVALFDCVTLWLSDHLYGPHPASDECILAKVDTLADYLAASPIPVALVTNEVGLGLVPDNAMGRRFRDLTGFANQRLGHACEAVVLAVCGQPLVIKTIGSSVAF